VDRTQGDRGDVVLGWLTKLVVALSLVGLLAFDGISLTLARFQAADAATSAAGAAADAYKSSRNVQAAYDAALGTVVSAGDTIETRTFTVAPDGTVTLQLHHQATTLLLHKVSRLRRYADAREEGKGRPGE